MISAYTRASASLPSGPAFFSSTRRNTWASRSGRYTLFPCLSLPTARASRARSFRAPSRRSSSASICARSLARSLLISASVPQRQVAHREHAADLAQLRHQVACRRAVHVDQGVGHLALGLVQHVVYVQARLGDGGGAVSYTHLTLPTIYSV